MSGHSKWANIKHRKASQDAKKANIFTKIAKDITIAAREGSDPETNFKLRLAIDKARSFNMPSDNIERAIKKGTGEIKNQAVIEEIIYEAYGPGQLALLIKVATDNRNRTVSEIRAIFNKKGGKFASAGAVNWQFENVGSLFLNTQEKQIEVVEEMIIESGAKDYEKGQDNFLVFTEPTELRKIKEKLEKAGIMIEEAALIFRAKNPIKIEEKELAEYEIIREALENQDDVVEIFDNLFSE